MVLLVEPRTPLCSGMQRQAGWKTLQSAGPVSVQKYVADPAETALANVQRALGGKDAGQYRVVTVRNPILELATAKTHAEAVSDTETLLLHLAGVEPDNPSDISEALRACLQQMLTEVVAEDPAAVENAADVGATFTDRRDAEVLRLQLEPWALRLMENADKFRYVCYALKIATSLGADIATGGFGGEEVVGLCFASVDAAILASWLAWFTSQLLDESPASNVVHQTLAFDFEGGPRAVVAQADSLCACMRPEDAEQVTKLALMLKRRFAVLVGDIISVLLPNDMGVGAAIVTEMLTRLQPVEAMDALKQLVDWYELIPERHRGVLEDHSRLAGTMQSTNTKVRNLVMSEYDAPLQRKAVNACKRGVVSLLIPGGPYLNLGASLAIGGNLGRGSCEEVFATVDSHMSDAAVTTHKVMAVAIGTLAVLAHCVDKAHGADSAQQPASSSNPAFSVLDTLAAASTVAPGVRQALSTATRLAAQ